MGFNETMLDVIRELDMVAYLAQLGYQPERVSKGYEYWYLSPLREEQTASFKVNRRRNRWYDFGISTGGNPVDFGLRYFHCDIPDFLKTFRPDYVFPVPRNIRYDLHEGRLDGSRLLIRSVRPLYAYSLKSYLQERCIPVAVAEQYCVQVDYKLNGRQLYGIGFRNDAGGFEIRNAFLKNSSAPKDVTTFHLGGDSVEVFEGFMDFLSWRVLHPNESSATDIVVLNGAGLFERALPFLQEHVSVHLWLDRDVTGLRYRDYAMSLGEKFVDESDLYRDFKDLNEWLCRQGSAFKPAQKLRLGI